MGIELTRNPKYLHLVIDHSLKPGTQLCKRRKLKTTLQRRDSGGVRSKGSSKARAPSESHNPGGRELGHQLANDEGVFVEEKQATDAVKLARDIRVSNQTTRIKQRKNYRSVIRQRRVDKKRSNIRLST